MRHSLKIFIVLTVAMLTSCIFDKEEKKADPVTLRNTYKDFQHIDGHVKGVWTKANNPHIITGYPTVLAGDTLILTEGVTLQGHDNIDAQPGSYLEIRGTAAEPVILHVKPAFSPPWGGGVTVSGKAKLSHFIDQEGINFAQDDSSASIEIDHATFIHASNTFHFFDPTPTADAAKEVQVVPVTIRNSIFAIPIGPNGNRGAFALYIKNGLADTAHWIVDSNCFMNTNENAVSMATKTGNVVGKAWPSSSNIAVADSALFVKYTGFWKDSASYKRSLSELITDVYDLHLQATSPCKGMGAYEE